MRVIYDEIGPRVIICHKDDSMAEFYLVTNEKVGYNPKLDEDENWYVEILPHSQARIIYEYRKNLQRRKGRYFSV